MFALRAKQEAPAPDSAAADGSHVTASSHAAAAVSFEDEEFDYDDFHGYGVVTSSTVDLTGDAQAGVDLGASTGMKSQATLTNCSHTTLPEVGELLQDRIKLMLCGVLILLHSVALIVLDILMMRKRCSPTLGGSFAVFAASLAVAIATGLLAFVRVFGRRALICVACVWIGCLTMDACWVCLTFPQLDIANCLGTAMIGVTAVGLVACPASLVAFVIMHSWYRVKPSDGQQ